MQKASHYFSFLLLFIKDLPRAWDSALPLFYTLTRFNILEQNGFFNADFVLNAEKSGIPRWGFVISIDRSEYEYHQKSEVSPEDRQKRRKNSESGPIFRRIPAKSTACRGLSCVSCTRSEKFRKKQHKPYSRSEQTSQVSVANIFTSDRGSVFTSKASLGQG